MSLVQGDPMLVEMLMCYNKTEVLQTTTHWNLTETFNQSFSPTIKFTLYVAAVLALSRSPRDNCIRLTHNCPGEGGLGCRSTCQSQHS